MPGWDTSSSQEIAAWALPILAIAFLVAICLIRKYRRSRRQPAPVQEAEIVFVGGERPDVEQAEQLAKEYGLEVQDIRPVECIDASQHEPKVTPTCPVRLQSRQRKWQLGEPPLRGDEEEVIQRSYPERLMGALRRQGNEPNPHKLRAVEHPAYDAPLGPEQSWALEHDVKMSLLCCEVKMR